MAMIRVGMGATGETAVTTTPPPPPMGKLDQFVAGAKTWMSPSQIPAALKAVVSIEAWKVAPMALVGLLSVPAALLLVVLGGMGVAKRRRAKNPRRGQVVVRRPRKPASWTCGHCGRRVSGQYDVCQCGDTRKWARASNPRRGRRTANPRRHGRRRNPSAKSTRRKIYARRKKNPRFHVAKYGTQGGVNYWGVYDGQAHKFVSPATRNYHAQVKLAGRMNRDEPGYGAQKKAAAYAKRRIGRIANRKRKPGRTVRRAALSAKILAGTPLTAAESFDYGVTGWPAPPVGTRRHRSSSMGQWLRTRKSGPGSARKTVKRLRAKYR